MKPSSEVVIPISLPRERCHSHRLHESNRRWSCPGESRNVNTYRPVSYSSVLIRTIFGCELLTSWRGRPLMYFSICWVTENELNESAKSPTCIWCSLVTPPWYCE